MYATFRLERLNVDTAWKMIILRWTLKNWDGMVWIGFIWPRLGQQLARFKMLMTNEREESLVNQHN